MSVPIEAQATAVELAYLNLRGHRDNLRCLVEKGRRPKHELEQVDRQLADLRPAVATIKWLALNHDDIKAALARPAP